MWIGGFVTIMIYSNGAEAIMQANALITENGAADIWTENSQDILIES